MRLKPDFRPSIKKIIFSIILTITWIIYNIFTTERVLCKCNPELINRLCNSYYLLLPIKNNICCDCASLSDIISQYLLYILIPFIVGYIVFTLLDSLLPKKHKIGVYR
jgi:hypothetical protein